MVRSEKSLKLFEFAARFRMILVNENVFLFNNVNQNNTLQSSIDGT